jgi:dTDP-4-dehydrorhamnose reductase
MLTIVCNKRGASVMQILVTGAAGRLGGRLVELLNGLGHQVTGADIVGDHVERLDISEFQTTRAFITQLHPDIVIHPAAWTDVNGCALDPRKAIIINGFGTQHVALGAAACGAAIVYVSTNEVFDGRADRAYYEYDLTNPINPYGYSKWVGEQAVLSINPRHYIVRTAWLFAHGGKNFIQTILNAAKEGKPLRVVDDEIANPTYNDDVAEAVTRLIDTGRYGIYHLVNEGSASRFAFARYFLDRTGFQATPIEPIKTTDWPRPSMPPAYGALENMAARHIGISLRSWQDAVDAFLKKEGLML